MLGKEGSDRLLGGTGSDMLSGGNGDDLLLGEEGADMLVGAIGSDRFIGGEGADTFVFDAEGKHTDIIDDFIDGEDHIDLSAFTGLSFADLALSARNNHAVIDLTAHGGSKIILRKFNPADLDAADFIFAR